MNTANMDKLTCMTKMYQRHILATADDFLGIGNITSLHVLCFVLNSIYLRKIVPR